MINSDINYELIEKYGLEGHGAERFRGFMYEVCFEGKLFRDGSFLC
jgi:hypothetical protein